MDISAKITGIKYIKCLDDKLRKVAWDDLTYAINKFSSFQLQVDDNNMIALSCWVSPKRTRSYPYARVYNTYGCSCKRITIIPAYKDEGLDGDRDFLQWDTISLMSLLGVYVIISYYSDARKNYRYQNKITNQTFDINHVSSSIEKIISYHSDSLHWNMQQVLEIDNLTEKAENNYERISQQTGVEMHSKAGVKNKINELKQGRNSFMDNSRIRAQQAQGREICTTQPKECCNIGEKSILTIKNYLGGHYYFTADEARICDDKVFLVEAKHSKNQFLPSQDDIKDGLIKMILFTNLEEVMINTKLYSPIPILKLTSDISTCEDNLPSSKKDLLALLKKEAIANNFRIEYNNTMLI